MYVKAEHSDWSCELIKSHVGGRGLGSTSQVNPGMGWDGMGARNVASARTLEFRMPPRGEATIRVRQESKTFGGVTAV